MEVRTRIALSGEYPRWARSSALTTQMILKQPVRYEFSLIDAPTLLIIGQFDRTTLGRGLVPESVLATMGRYPELGRAAARDIPHATLVEVPNCGHIPHLEAPDAFFGALMPFLAR